MKKIFALLLSVILISCLFVGCTQLPPEQLVNQTSVTEETEPATERVNETNIAADKRTGDKRYIVTYEIKQSHFTLDLSEHFKDEMNKITIEIPVDEQYYNEVTVGQVISDEFRTGSLILRGSIGSWKITVIEKEVK